MSEHHGPGRPVTTGTRPPTSFRVDPDVLAAARAVAAERGELISNVVERALAAYARRHAS